ncbi:MULTISPECIES: YhbY family RNA-binding protein [Clostridium]|uniref:RNA-binding protein n=3 Tax=Clostridium TaxID=1485 RepID=A0A1J0GIV5_9CLOT|nr:MULTISPECIES: YhbY family RNA-binding protein [Clostridium]APC41330.1 RNA-binding protein [Clostridium estertheticum subsp. estertheticum]MBU3072994.1 YhbY family RNA-binding protein [Clostridium estertheticum]MBU3098444.1 YhbY family RNA-binding protein [Clostridium sp. DSM 17811]MBU3153546.1 YhbY family RNA-binding protein [Clostridium estertheticum]MBU3162969.1 YhbY family RNA-binding protein [Clostridium estertheticum]
MITSKQRSYLRTFGNKLQPLFQLGKAGIEQNFLKQIEEALESREIIKIKVLNNSGLTAREASDIICESIGAEAVQSIGSKCVLYKRSIKKPIIELP